ncbi:MAG: B12-binding domain-containing radical SAM protein [Desulfurococcales archaeon]|nr:B12-binding domain-containing radical SAM protein [Desulfurococcales archaeon]
MRKVDFIITTDRSMMTNHRGKEFLGFMTTSPPIGMPGNLWRWIAAPKVPVDEWGRPRQAPYGLRKIEAALQDAGFSAEVIDPDYVKKYIAAAKAVLIGHHDYFALNSPSIEYWMLTGREPLNRRSFLSFIGTVAYYKRKYNPGLRIVVGGPAAWQWLYSPTYLERFMVDTIVEGEADRVIVDLARAIAEGRETPRYILVGPRDVPGLDEIPVIKGASVNGLIEIMRGCPRGCSFCSVTYKAIRYYPLSKIEAELKVNTSNGVKGGVLHSDDVPLYGARGVTPNVDALERLHRLVKKYYRDFTWSHAALATILYGEERFKLLSRLADLILDENQEYMGFQTGIETGSKKLARRIMPGKSAPYPPEDWPEVVVEAFKLLHEKLFIPAGTIILGLPGETSDDVVKTIELVEELRPYRSLIVPMFFVPLGSLRGEGWFKPIKMTVEHAELLREVMRHTAYWSKDIISRVYMKGIKYTPAKILLIRFISRVEKIAETIKPEDILDYVENVTGRQAITMAA